MTAKRNWIEKIHFRLLNMQCCNVLLCHVNSRLPMYCSSCGKLIYPEVRGWVVISDDNAKLTYMETLK